MLSCDTSNAQSYTKILRISATTSILNYFYLEINAAQISPWTWEEQVVGVYVAGGWR